MRPTRIVIAILAAPVIGGTMAGCASTTKPADPSEHHASHKPEPAYGGIGSPARNFRLTNNTRQLPNGTNADYGVPTYHIDATNSSGRVTAYSVSIPATPRLSNRERMALLQGINVPTDTQPIDDSSTCIVLESNRLGQMIGRRYAAIATITGSITATITTQQVQPRCH